MDKRTSKWVSYFLEVALVVQEDKEVTKDDKPVYQPPKVVTYTSKDIVEAIGPAQACSPGPF